VHSSEIDKKIFQRVFSLEVIGKLKRIKRDLIVIKNGENK
jgi:hypothetical protein